MGRLISLWLILAIFYNFSMEKKSLSAEECQKTEGKKLEAMLSLEEAIAAHYEEMNAGVIADPKKSAKAVWYYFLAKNAEKNENFQGYGFYLKKSAKQGFKIAYKELFSWNEENTRRCVAEIQSKDEEAQAVWTGLNTWILLELVHSKLVEKEEPKKNEEPPEGMYN